MEKKFPNIAFISYSHKDKKWAKWLQRKLETYRLPSVIHKEFPNLPKHVRPVFRDETDIGTGRLVDELQKELEGSRFLIVICSPYSAHPNKDGLHYVNHEVTSFMELGRGDHIIPFIVDGEPDSKTPSLECYCPALNNMPEEEILLGINVPELGKPKALVKTVARILNLRFDELWRRHRRRQVRRNIALAVFALFIFLSLAFAAVFSTFQWRHAEIRRQESEELLNYMLVELHGRLKQWGRLNILGDVADKSLEYVKSLEIDSTDPLDTLQAITLRRNMAEVHGICGRLNPARSLREKNVAVLRDMIRIDPKSEILPMLMAEEFQGLASIEEKNGNLKKAEENYLSALQIFKTSVRGESKASWRLESAVCQAKLAGFYYKQKRDNEALPLCENAVTVIERLTIETDIKESARLELAYALVIQARIISRQDSLQDGAEVLRRAVTFFKSHLDTHPDDWTAWSRYSNALSELGAAYRELGNWDEAVLSWDTVVKVDSQLVEREPLNTYWRNSLCMSLMNKANILSGLGRLDEAISIYEQVKAERRKLITLEPENIEWKSAYAVLLHNLATDRYETGEVKDAENLWTEAIQILDEMHKNGSARPQDILDLCDVLEQRTTACINERGKKESMGDLKRALSLKTDLLENTAVASSEDYSALGHSYARLGLMFYQMGEYTHALAPMEQAILWQKKAKESNSTNKEHSKILARIYRNKAIIAKDVGRGEDALEAAQESITILKSLRKNEPEDIQLSLNLAKSLNNLAIIHCEAERVKCSIDAWEESLAVYNDVNNNPEFCAARLGSLAYQYLLINEFTKAEEKVRAALSIQPLLWIQINLGHTLLLQGNEKDALKIYKDGVSHDPSMLSTILADLKELSLLTFVELDPGNVMEALQDILKEKEL